MPGLQEWIHRMEEGEGSRWIKGLTFWAAVAALLLLYDLREFKNFSAPEAMDAAQVGRNLAEGRGFTTHFIRPISTYLVHQQTGDPHLGAGHPDLAQAPVYPALLSALMKWAPMDFTAGHSVQMKTYAPELWITGLNQLFWLLSLWLAWRLARVMFDEPVAWVSALLLAGSDLYWRFSLSGLSTNLLILIFLLLLHVLRALEWDHREGQSSSAKLAALAALAGLLTGLGLLTRYSFGWLILPLLAFLVAYFPGRRALLALTAAGVFLVVVSPWLSRNHQWSGRWFGVASLAVAQDTDRFPGSHLERALTPYNPAASTDLGKVDLDDHLGKLAANLPQVLQHDLPRLGGNWIAAFFLAGLLLPFKSPALARLRVFLLLSIVLFSAVQALGRTHLSALSPDINSENLLAVVAPLAFIYGTGMVSVFLDQLNLTYPQLRQFLAGWLVAVASLPMFFNLWEARSTPLSYPPYYPAVIQETAGWLEEKEWMISDMPWAVAWYGRRPCMWLTWAPDQEFLAAQQRKPFAALYLTALTLDGKLQSQMLNGPDAGWGRLAAESLVKEEVPTGFPWKFAPRGLFPDQLFLADRERWKPAAR